MWLSKVADAINRVVQPVSRVIHSVGLVVLAAMMFLTFADVALRYIFNRPISGSFDLTELMMVVVACCGFAYCAVMKGHVNVDLVVSRLRQRNRAIVETITGLLGLTFLFLVTLQAFLYIKVMYLKGLVSAVLHIPVYPLVAVAAVGLAMLWLVLLADILNIISRAVRK